ncbi:glycosyltransferase family 4 protein [Candidatus Woesearchaeota archaeon]|jgi:glycosyltransferase involved in cell wall biosynthesis|nr:glycosyltransferase family 4 protein [Candidatus Woesearchaeota archaeon]
MKKQKIKLLIINPSVREYRVGFYDRLHKSFQTKFIFTHSDYWIEKEFKEMKNWNYKILKEIPFVGYSRGFSPKLIIHLLFDDYDVVVNQHFLTFAAHFGFLIVKLRRKKWISWEETWLYPTTFLSKLTKWYSLLTLKKSDVCVAAGAKSKSFLIKSGVNPAHIFIAPNSAIDLSKLIDNKTVQKIKTRFKLKQGFTFIFVGRISEEKGIPNLINAFNKLSKKDYLVKLIIVGYYDSPGKNYYKKCRKLSKHNSRIFFVGKKTGSDLANYLAAADIKIVPSIFMFNKADCTESWGMVVNEAMSCGNAVIASNAVGSAGDLVKEGVNGFIFKQKNEIDLLDKMETILKQDVKKMGVKSKKIIQTQFNYDNMLKIFKKAILVAIKK